VVVTTATTKSISSPIWCSGFSIEPFQGFDPGSTPGIGIKVLYVLFSKTYGKTALTQIGRVCGF